MEPAKNNVRGEERNKKKEPQQGSLWDHWVSSGLTSSLPPSTPSSNDPLLLPPKEKLKAFFWEQRGLPRLLLFTFGRTAIGGKFKHRKRPLVTGRAADRLGGWSWLCWVCSLLESVQLWDLTAGPCLSDTRHPVCNNSLDCFFPLGLLLKDNAAENWRGGIG